MSQDIHLFVPESDQENGSEEEGRGFNGNAESEAGYPEPQIEMLTPNLKIVASYQPDHQAKLRVLKFLIEKGETSCPPPSTSEYRPLTPNRKR